MTLATVVAIVAALAAVAATIAIRLHRGPCEAVDLLPVKHLYVEGRSDDPRVGAVRGPALAAEVPRNRHEVAQAGRYLVDDPRKAAPVWVAANGVQRLRSELTAGTPVLGYITIDETTGPGGASLGRMEAACARSGWQLTEIVCDEPTDGLRRRPGLRYALRQIADGHARALIVGNVGRLAGSVGELTALLEWFRSAEAAVVIPELGLDTSTSTGYEAASTLIAITARERVAGTAPAISYLARMQNGRRSEGRGGRRRGLHTRSLARHGDHARPREQQSEPRASANRLRARQHRPGAAGAILVGDIKHVLHRALESRRSDGG